MKSATWITVLAAALLWSQPAAAASAELCWKPPTHNTDGTVLTDLAGYNIFAGCFESGTYELAPQNADADATCYTYTGLPYDTLCYFVGTALNSAGVESAYSNEAVKTLPPLAGEPPGKPSIDVTWPGNEPDEPTDTGGEPVMSYVSTGAGAVTSTTTITPGAPPGSSDKDIWVLRVVYDRGGDSAPAASMDSAWTEKLDVNLDGDGLGLAVFWHRYDGVTTPVMTVTIPDNAGGSAFVSAYAGRKEAGDPFDSVSAVIESSGSTINFADLTPTQSGVDVITARGSNNDRATTGVPTNYTAEYDPGGDNALITAVGDDTSVAGHYREDQDTTTITGLTETQAGSTLYISVLMALAPAAGGGSTVQIGQVTESSQPQAIASAKQHAVSFVTETDLSQSISAAKAQAVGMVTEFDVTFAVESRKARSIGLVAESDFAQSLSGTFTVQLGQVAETDLAQALSLAKLKSLTQVSESALAQTIASEKARAIAQILEADVAQAIQVATGLVINQVSELDTVTTLGASKQKGIAQIAEVDSVFAIGVQRVLSLLQAAETDTVFALSIAKLQALGLVTELDVAFAMTVVGGNAIGPINNPGITSGSPARGFTSATVARGISSQTVRRGFTKH